MLFELIAAASFAGQEIDIRGYDPPAADAWEQSVTFTCGDATVHISGYGAARPLDRPAEITVNRKPVSGTAAAALKRDLSDRRAVYRLGARCPKDSGTIALIIHSGEKAKAGNVIFRAGSALLKGDHLESYSGLQAVDADSFWFR